MGCGEARVTLLHTRIQHVFTHAALTNSRGLGASGRGVWFCPVKTAEVWGPVDDGSGSVP